MQHGIRLFLSRLRYISTYGSVAMWSAEVSLSLPSANASECIIRDVLNAHAFHDPLSAERTGVGLLWYQIFEDNRRASLTRPIPEGMLGCRCDNTRQVLREIHGLIKQAGEGQHARIISIKMAG